MKQKQNNFTLYMILTVITFVIVIYLILQYIPKANESELISIPDLSTIGYLKVDVDASVSGNDGVVILQTNCYQLTAVTEQYQAQSIANGIAGKVDFRPNTHDLMKDALNNLGIEVKMVKIVEMRNNTFIGRLILKQGNKVVSLDSRPSDGIALAVRTGSPVYIKESLMEEQGKYIC
jgi:bifunctional DNase/RNase